MGRVEILTGVERRRVWSDEEKLRILDEIAASGLSVAAIARRHDILPQQIYTWRKRFGGGSDVSAGSAIRFLPVTLKSPECDLSGERSNEEMGQGGAVPRRSSKATRIEIGCKGGRVLKVDSDLAPELLKALIRSVEAA